MTKLDNVVYATWTYPTNVIYKLDENTLKPLGVVSTGKSYIDDMVAGTDDRKLYFSHRTSIYFMSVDDDSFGTWIYKYDPEAVHFKKLSLTSRNSILAVTQMRPYTNYTLREYSFSDGSEIAQLKIPLHVERVLHAVRLSTGAYVVSYKGTPSDPEKFAVSKLTVYRHVIKAQPER